MVICFEEKDRQLIEENFGSIIEFKRKLYGITLFERKLVKAINETWDNVKEVVMQLIECFKCTALAIVIPEDVKTAYTEKSKSFKHMNAGMRNTGFSNEAYNDGFVTGKGAMSQRSLEAI